MVPTICFVLLTAASLPVLHVSSYKLSIKPDHAFLGHSRNSLTVICTADVALTGCQFLWTDNKAYTGPLLDLSRGSQSVMYSSHLNAEVVGYSYSGRGLESGDCGVTLQVEGNKKWMVGCRVRVQNGAWEYAWMDLFAEGYALLPSTVIPREVVVLPGGETRILAKIQEQIRLCRFTLQGAGEINFDQGPQSSSSTSRHRYYGSGLNNGECGIVLSDISEQDNGPVGVYPETLPAHDYKFIAVIVASPPSTPVLKVVRNDTNIEATCFVNESRPVAGITWFIGSDIVRDDFLDDSPISSQDKWRWPWVKTSITQKLILTLASQYMGKDLKCRVSHVSLNQPLEASERITFTEPRKEDSWSPSNQDHTCRNVDAPTQSILDLLLQELKVRAPLLGNTSCPSDELLELRVKEARALGVAAEYAAQIGKATLVTTQARAREAEAHAKIAEEELQILREQRSRKL